MRWVLTFHSLSGNIGAVSLKVLVINLDRSPERLAKMREQLATLQIEMQRVRGIDASLMSAKELDAFRAAHLRPDGGIWHTGQIGCLLSHISAWKVIASGTDDAASIFEDDVQFSANSTFFLSSSSWIPGDADIVRLERPTNGVKMGRKFQLGDRCIRKVYSEAWGAAGYVVTKRVAEALVKTPKSLLLPSDSLLFNKAASAIARHLSVYQVVPALCQQDRMMHRERKFGFASTIVEDGWTRQAPPPSGKLRSLKKTLRQVMGMAAGRRRVPFS